MLKLLVLDCSHLHHQFDEERHMIRFLGNSYIFEKYSLCPGTGKDIDEKRLLRTRPIFSKSVMVSVGFSKLGCTAIHFVKPGVKVNGEYNWTTYLEEKLLPNICRLSQNEFFVFQQDSIAAHRARDTITFLKQQMPDFISPILWPPILPDLDPVNYSVWSVLQENVYRSKIADIDELKTHLINEWASGIV